MWAALGLKLLGVKSWFTSLSPRTKMIIFIAIATVALFFVHRHLVSNFRDKVTKEVNTTWQKRLDKEHQEALTWKNKFDQSQAKMALEIRSRHEETLRADAALANSLRLRGAGAARCGQGDHSRVTTGAGGLVSGSGQADPAVDTVPNGEGVELIGLPFAATINAGQQCDANRSEVISWRAWHKQLELAWPK